MCGICGIVDFYRQVKDKKELTHVMSSNLSHRGPDDSGEFNDEFISMGFRRLSILDIEKGNQPVTNKNKKIISIFNGEIFNFKEIRNELKIKGFNFKTNSDSEIIPYAYEVWGINFVKRLNGMFSIAIYDKSKNIFYLIRDRLGIKPLYYYEYKKA